MRTLHQKLQKVLFQSLRRIFVNVLPPYYSSHSSVLL